MKDKPSELDLYIARQDELVERYNGKIIALHHGEVEGTFETELDALRAMQRKYEPGDFMIIRCAPGPSEYTTVIHTPFRLMPGNSGE